MNNIPQILFFYLLFLAYSCNSSEVNLDLAQIFETTEAENRNVFSRCWKEALGRRKFIFREYDDRHFDLRVYRKKGYAVPMGDYFNPNKASDSGHTSDQMYETTVDFVTAKGLKLSNAKLCIATKDPFDRDNITNFVKAMLYVNKEDKPNRHTNQKKIFRYFKSLLRLPSNGLEFDYTIHIWIPTSGVCSLENFQ